MTEVCVINYIKRDGPRKELSIFIEPHLGADVTDPALQEKFIWMLVRDGQPVDCDISLDLGLPTFVVDYTRTRSGGRTLHVRGFLAFSHGNAYRIVVSSYASPVDEDAEIMALKNALRIIPVVEDAPTEPELTLPLLP